MKILKDFLWALFFVIVLLLALGIFYKPTPPVQIIDREIIKRDTIVVVDYIEADPIYIKEQIFVRDTIYISTDGDSTATGVASLDTAFVDGAELSVLYYIKPRIYEIEYTSAPVEAQTINVTNTEYVYIDSSARPFWDRFKYGFATGVPVIATIIYLVKPNK
jgi:hypothetical protein